MRLLRLRLLWYRLTENKYRGVRSIITRATYACPRAQLSAKEEATAPLTMHWRTPEGQVGKMLITSTAAQMPRVLLRGQGLSSLPHFDAACAICEE